MADKNPSIIHEKPQYVKKIQRGLDNWREVTLLANSVLLWKNKFSPWILIGCTTVLFLELAYYEPSGLTTVSLICLCLTLMDYFGPIISSTIWKQDTWTASKERELEEICVAIADFIIMVKLAWTNVLEIKASRPNLYYTVTITTLCILAWIGNSVNNFLITYFIAVMAVLMPGLIHNGILQKYYRTLLSFLAQTLRGCSSSQKTKLH